MDKIGYLKYLTQNIIAKKTYILLLYKRIYLCRHNYANKTEYERNEIEILISETNFKINNAKSYVRTKELEVKHILENG